MTLLRARQKFGKYVIERKLAEGGFAMVYQARDTIEGIRVALKIPYAHLVTDEALEDFRHEVRVAAQMEHPNILPLKYADHIDGHFVIVTAMGQTTLEERLQKRLSVETASHFARQMLDAVAYAHDNRIVHCDVKPDNFLIFPSNVLKLTDFGIARVDQKTIHGSGAGTLGYMAPEQAMGRPSFRSDVFAVGIILYRMFSGQIPEWPFHWPMPGHERLKRNLHADLIALIRKSIEVDSKKRFRDANKMLDAFLAVKSPNKRNARAASPATSAPIKRNWKTVRHREFQKQFGKQLETCHQCESCQGPVSEVMLACPWCGKARKKHNEEKTRFTVACPRCQRGLKSDWRYCPWCFGAGFEPSSARELSDRRYETRCVNSKCRRKDLMPFMRYCPWCKCRVKKKWKIEGCSDHCSSCRCGVSKDFWSHCPWCTKRIVDK